MSPDPATEPPAPLQPTTVIIVDGTNLIHRCRAFFKREDIHFGTFFTNLAGGVQPDAVHYFTAMVEPRNWNVNIVKAQRIRQADLGRLSPWVKVKLGRYVPHGEACHHCGKKDPAPVEKGTDVGVACCIMDHVINRKAGRLILVTADTDYLPAVQFARQQGMPVTLAFPLPAQGDQQAAREMRRALTDMRECAGSVIELDETWFLNCWIPIALAKIRAQQVARQSSNST